MPLPIVPPGLAQHADDERDALLAQLEAGGIAAAIMAEDGRYFQGLPQPAVVPEDGAAGDTDTSAKPSDRAKSYEQAGVSLTAHPKVQTAVDEYLAPGGAGYVIRQAVTLAGTRWQRVVHVQGPETWRAYDWIKAR